MQFNVLLIAIAIIAAAASASPAAARSGGTEGEFQFAGTKNTAANSGEFEGKGGDLL